MKRIQLKLTIAAALLWCNASMAQESDSLGVIGDDLDLYAVLDAFKDAESIESFEKTINSEDAKINNLDLDEDGQIDYITVNDEGEGDVHAFILSIDMSEEEAQDVAVIELEKTNSNEATIQIVGDEEIYGEDFIIEPKNPDEITKRLLRPNVIIVNVWGWRGVRFVYAPGYTRWRSPWRWNRHPRWWRPWRPVRWGVYHGWHVHRRRYYHPVRTRRCVRAHGFYVKKRRTCVKIKKHKHHHGNKQANHNGNNHGNHNGHNHGNHNGHHKDQKNNGANKSQGQNKFNKNKQQSNSNKNKQQGNKQHTNSNKKKQQGNKQHTNSNKNKTSNKNRGNKR